MEAKDWILLFVPILCNGIIVFAFQKAFEKRQMTLIEKYKYVSTLQQKVDDALAMFTKVLQSTGNDLEQIACVNNFIACYCDVFYYFQQNKTLLKSFEHDISKIVMIHEQLQSIPQDENYASNIEPLFRQIFELLQSIQNDCISRKI